MTEEAQNIDIEITEEKIEKAALPENRRVEEEVVVVGSSSSSGSNI